MGKEYKQITIEERCEIARLRNSLSRATQGTLSDAIQAGPQMRGRGLGSRPRLRRGRPSAGMTVWVACTCGEYSLSGGGNRGTGHGVI